MHTEVVKVMDAKRLKSLVFNKQTKRNQYTFGVIISRGGGGVGKGDGCKRKVMLKR